MFDPLKKTSVLQIAPKIFGAKIQTTIVKPISTDSLSLLEKKLSRCLEIHISFKESSGLDHDVGLSLTLFEFSCQNYSIHHSSSSDYVSTLDKSQFVRKC